MSRPSNEVLFKYLQSWRSSREVKEKFDLSNTEWHNICKWLLKGGFVERVSTVRNNRTNRIYLYKIIPE